MEDQHQLSKEEKASVLAVLNDFSETFKQEAKARIELREKINKVLESKASDESSATESSSFEKEVVSLMDLQKIKLEHLLNYIQKNNLPPAELAELKREMAEHKQVLNNPPAASVLHHHHVPKTIMATIGLALVALLLGYRLLVTAGKLDNYIESDTKYRYMKLDMTENGRAYLHQLDSLYNAYPNMRDSILTVEEVRQQKIERLIEAQELREKAKELEK